MSEHTLILGAGLTGLTAAYHLKQAGLPFTILEMKDRAGGNLHAGRKNGFYFDAGTHILETKNPVVLDFIRSDLKIELIETRSKAFFVSGSKLVPYPFQLNTYCLPVVDRFRVLIENLYSRLSSDLEPENYESFLLQHFGPTLCKHYFFPYAKKSWTVKPSKLTTEWVTTPITRFNYWERLMGLWKPVHDNTGPHSYFHYPVKGGISAIITSLTKAVKENIVFRSEVNRIEPLTRKVTCKNGNSFSYKHCIATLPLPDLYRLLDQPQTQDYLQLSKHLRFTSVLCWNVGLRGRPPHNFHAVYFPDLKEPMTRVHFPGNLSPEHVPKGCHSVQIELVGRSVDPWSFTTQNLFSKETFEHCLSRLEQLSLIGSRKRVVFTSRYLIHPAEVIFDHFRSEHLKKFLGFLKELGIIPAGRYGEWGYHRMDDSIISGINAANQIAGSVDVGFNHNPFSKTWYQG